MCYCIVSVVSPMITPINQSGKGGNINGGSLRLVQTCRCPFLLSSGQERSSKYIGLSGSVSGQVPQLFRVWFPISLARGSLWKRNVGFVTLVQPDSKITCVLAVSPDLASITYLSMFRTLLDMSQVKLKRGANKNFHHLKSSCRRILAARRVDAGSRL